MQDTARHFVANLIAVVAHFGTLAKHLIGHFEGFAHDWRWPFFFGQREPLFPTSYRQLPRNFFRELDRCWFTVLHAHHCDRGTQAQKAHTMTPLALNLIALLRQWQAVDFHNIIEHACEHFHDLAEVIPVKGRFRSERLADKAGQIDRAQQA